MVRKKRSMSNAINTTMFCNVCKENIKEVSGMEHARNNHIFDARYGQILKKGEKPRKSLIDINR